MAPPLCFASNIVPVLMAKVPAKMHDFSIIDMIIKTKQMFFIRETSCKGTALFWKRGRGAAAHLHLKRHVVSTQNRHFLNYIINNLWGILRHLILTYNFF